MPTPSAEIIQKRLEKLELKMRQEKNKLRAINAKNHARENAQARKARDRRLIITGAVMWNMAERDEVFRVQLLKWLDGGIPENRNRVLFDLTPRPEGTNEDGQR